jgi:hypothetical protein
MQSNAMGVATVANARSIDVIVREPLAPRTRSWYPIDRVPVVGRARGVLLTTCFAALSTRLAVPQGNEAARVDDPGSDRDLPSTT